MSPAQAHGRNARVPTSLGTVRDAFWVFPILRNKLLSKIYWEMG